MTHWVRVVVTELTRDVPWYARVEVEDGAHDRNDLSGAQRTQEPKTHAPSPSEYYSVSSLNMIDALVCRVNAEVPHTTKSVCIVRYTSLRCQQHPLHACKHLKFKIYFKTREGDLHRE